jgi:hypothetical protein
MNRIKKSDVRFSVGLKRFDCKSNNHAKTFQAAEFHKPDMSVCDAGAGAWGGACGGDVKAGGVDGGGVQAARSREPDVGVCDAGNTGYRDQYWVQYRVSRYRQVQNTDIGFNIGFNIGYPDISM